MIYTQIQFPRIQSLIQHAFDHSPAMKQQMENAGVTPLDIRSWEDFALIPVTTKEAHIRRQAESPPDGGFLTVPLNRLDRISLHPGPVYDWHTGCGSESVRAFVRSLGFSRDDVVAVTFSYHLMGAGAVFDQVLRELGVTVIAFGPGNRDLLVRAMKDLGVTCFVGTLNYLHVLIRHGEALGLDFHKDIRLRKALVGAERVSPSLRRELETEYGIDCRQGYGTSEISIAAWECGQKNGMHINDTLVVELIDPDSGQPSEPGRPGELVVTLLDFERPLLRFGTGDLAVITTAPCPCGHRAPRLVRIQGRVGGAHKVRGRFIHESQLDGLLNDFSEIKALQILLAEKDRNDRVTLRVHLRQAVPDTEALADRLREKARDLFGVRIDEATLIGPADEFQGYPAILDQRRWE